MLPAPRVLFVGDSFTYFNNLPRLVGIVGGFRTERVTRSSWNLDRHWREGLALARIRAGGWSVVVLQEEGTLPISDPRRFQADVRRFAAEIRKAGARPMLLMTWPQRTKPWVQVPLADAFRRVGTALHVGVIPVGEAWRRWPDPKGLYVGDGIHPSFRGSLLAALTVAGALCGRPLTSAPTDFGTALGVAHPLNGHAFVARIDPAELPRLVECAREALLSAARPSASRAAGPTGG